MLPRTADLLGRKYRLGAELGRGAMGIVYEARHEALDQRVAIKILRRSEVDDEEAAVRRFEREARIVAKLDSPHVVKVMDVDRTEEGVPYLVMELLEGRDLSAEVEARGEPVPIVEAVGWALQICEAMCVAHDAGVVHRDLKLSNVFLTKAGTLKVLDFGVAVLRSGDPERSITTSVAGTPRYMAPEQLLGEPPNPASDIWAIGVILYRTLGGRFPYDAPTMAAQMLAMMEGCPSLDAVAPRVPHELAEIVGRALGHTLETRWPSARALSLALAPFGAAPAFGAPAVVAGPALGAAPAVVAGPAVGPARGAAELSSPPHRAAPLRRALLVAAAGLLVLGVLALRGGRRETETPVASPPPIDAARAPVLPALLPLAVSGAVSATPADVRSAPLPLASTPAPRGRPAPLPPAASSPGPRALSSPGGSTNEGFPPHL